MSISARPWPCDGISRELSELPRPEWDPGTPGEEEALTIEYTDRLRAIPTYPAAATYAYEGDLVKLASNETPWPPHHAVLEAAQ